PDFASGLPETPDPLRGFGNAHPETPTAPAPAPFLALLLFPRPPEGMRVRVKLPVTWTAAVAESGKPTMHDLLAGEETGVRFWAIASSAILALLSLLAGGSLLFAERLASRWDLELPRLFE